MGTPPIVIVGGGFAGINAAKSLSGHGELPPIYLIDGAGEATMVPGLPDVLSGRVPTSAFARPIEELFTSTGNTSVKVIRDTVLQVDLTKRRVTATSGEFDYSALILAAGSEPEFHGFEPEEGRLYTVHTLENALAYRRAIEDRLQRVASEPQKVQEVHAVIVGGGYTGIEVAACLRLGLAEATIKPRITIVELADEVLPFMSEKRRGKVVDYLKEIDVDLRTGTGLSQLKGETATLSDGSVLKNSVVCWAAGMRAPRIEIAGSIETTRDHRIETNDYLQVPGYPEVFVAGDMAALRKDGELLRRAVNFSFYSGKQAGKNAAAFLRNKALDPFKPVDLGWIIPLGGLSTGRIFGSLLVGGRFGLRLHYLMCGFRHFGVKEGWEFYKTAFHLDRSPARLLARPS
jgi:NADH dehydrogenase